MHQLICNLISAAKDDTYYYVKHVNGAQVAVLAGTFLGAALIVVVGFAAFSIIMTKLEGYPLASLRRSPRQLCF